GESPRCAGIGAERRGTSSRRPRRHKVARLMCRSRHERPPDGRRCPRQHSVGGYSDSRENRAARKQLSRARQGLLQARATEDSAIVDRWEQKVVAAQQRVNETKGEGAGQATADLVRPKTLYIPREPPADSRHIGSVLARTDLLTYPDG